MNFKDYSSPLVDRVREAASTADNQCPIPFDPAEELGCVSFGRHGEYDRIRTCRLVKPDGPTGAALGGFGQEDDPAMLYLAILFPTADTVYEVICYRYNRDKFFVFRDGKLLGQFRGDYAGNLDEVRQWEIMSGETLSGLIPVPDNPEDAGELTVNFSGEARELHYRLSPPPRFSNWRERFVCGLTAGLLAPPLKPDPVLRGRPRFRSRPESEVYFCAFVFFRLMAYNQD